MFASGANIQGWPTPTLFVKRGKRDLDDRQNLTSELELTGGAYVAIVVNGGAFGPESASAFLELTGGEYVLVVVNGGAFGPELAECSLDLTGGEYVLVVVNGGAFGPESAESFLDLTGGEYAVVVVAGGNQTQTLTNNLALTGGLYTTP